MKKLLEEILKDDTLLPSNEAFLSEADFQFNLAKKLNEIGCTNVIVEYPIRDEDTDNHNSNNNQHNTRIDIYCEYQGIMYFFELKYKTKEKEVIRHKNMKFSLKTHGAYPDNRYYIYRDIQRLENIISNKNKDKLKCIGFVLFLTNDTRYTKEYEGKFPLCNKTNSGNLSYSDKTNILLEKQYVINWHNFGCHEDFKYMLIEIK